MLDSSDSSTEGAKVNPTATSPSEPLTEREASAKKLEPLSCCGGLQN